MPTLPSSASRLGARFLALSKMSGERTGGIFYQVPSHVGHVAYVTLQPMVGVYQANECLAVVALLDVVHTTDSLFVGGIAADSPYRVRRVEDDAAPAHDFYRLSDVFFFIHVRMFGLNLKFTGEMEFDVLEIVLGHLEHIVAVGQENVAAFTILGMTDTCAF